MINRLLGKSLFGLLAACAFAPLAQAADAPTLNTGSTGLLRRQGFNRQAQRVL